MTDQLGFRALELPAGVAGALYLSSMPGRYRPFDRDLREADELGVATVLCLNPRDEIEWKSPHSHAALNDGSHGWRVIEHPIEDFRAPGRNDAFVALIDDIAGHLRAGERLMLHCAGGIGRTGTVGSCILIALGLSPDEALATVRRARAWPENKAQTDFVHWFAAREREAEIHADSAD
jgi:protein tyrosine/serine phosphatase